jgi:hypothetical protein
MRQSFDGYGTADNCSEIFRLVRMIDALCADSAVSAVALEQAALNKRIDLHIAQVRAEVEAGTPERAYLATVRLVQMIKAGPRGLWAVDAVRSVGGGPVRLPIPLMAYQRMHAARQRLLDCYIEVLEIEGPAPSLQYYEVNEARERELERASREADLQPGRLRIAGRGKRGRR